MANTFDVQAYNADKALPYLYNNLGTVRTLNLEYEGWTRPEQYGTRGDKFSVKIPTRLSVQSGLTFDASAAGFGDYQERQMTISADQKKFVPYAISTPERATFNEKGLLNTNAKSALENIATEMDAFAAERVAFTGYRAFGDFNVQADQMTTVGEVTNASAIFRSFGACEASYYTVPDGVGAKIVQSGLQQFTIDRNNELAMKGELGKLNGVRNMTFMESNVLPVHIAGTASVRTVNFSDGYNITAVVVTAPSNNVTSSQAGTTVISLSGGTNGDTIVLNDMIDIGFLNTANPLLFQTFNGYKTSEQKVQGRVTVGGTFAGGILDITIEPALTFDATNVDPTRNLNRAIINGTDTLRVAKSHRAGLIYHGMYGAFVCPPLGDEDPYKTGYIKLPEIPISCRSYYGAVLGAATKVFIHDVIYGFGGAAEGLGRILLSIQ